MRTDLQTARGADLTVYTLAAIYAAITVALAAGTTAAIGAQAGILAFLFAMIVGLLVAGVTMITVMTVLDTRRAAQD